MMKEDLAANSRGFANPEGAANAGENAPLPEIESAEQAPVEANEEKGAENSREWTRKVAQRIKDERQKAQNELVTELFGSEEALNAYRARQEQERLSAEEMQEAALFAELALAADPELGGHYLALQDEVHELAAAHEVDVESAFLLVLRQHLPRLLREERQKGEQELLAKLAENSAMPGSLAGAASTQTGLQSLNDREFAAVVARVKRGEFRS